MIFLLLLIVCSRSTTSNSSSLSNELLLSIQQKASNHGEDDTNKRDCLSPKNQQCNHHQVSLYHQSVCLVNRRFLYSNLMHRLPVYCSMRDQRENVRPVRKIIFGRNITLIIGKWRLSVVIDLF